jgi:uncharacterized protein (TIGR00645 family)
VIVLRHLLEKTLFASRWLLAPIYIALALSLIALVVKAGLHGYEIFTHILGMSEAELMLSLLSLVDMTLTASLIIIVIFSGYENFVARIDPAQYADWPDWMAHIDFAGLKLKLMSSIVAISAVHLLSLFMEISSISDRELMWSIALHIVFILSTLALAYTEYLAAPAHSSKAHE